jgi:hypothetical protein
MTVNDEDKKWYLNAADEDEEIGGEGKGGKGGKSGEIEFRYHDIFSSEPRDDALPQVEIDRLLRTHIDLHKDRVDKQKATRKERDDIKKGKKHQTGYDALGLRAGGGGGSLGYKTHPLSNHAQFSGAVDKKVTGVPCDSLAETNDDQKQQLLAELDLRHQHKHVPKHSNTPKPRPY